MNSEIEVRCDLCLPLVAHRQSKHPVTKAKQIKKEHPVRSALCRVGVVRYAHLGRVLGLNLFGGASNANFYCSRF